MLGTYKCRLTLDNDDEYTHSEDALNFADNDNLVQISYLLDKSISGDICSEDFEKRSSR